MRRHHYRGRGDPGRRLSEPHAAGPQFGQHGFVLHEVAQDREWLVAGRFQSQGDGVLDSETHAQMFSADYFHKVDGARGAGGGAHARFRVGF